MTVEADRTSFVHSFKGVQFIAPPERLIRDLTQSMQRALEQVPEDKSGALVAVVTESGVNAAIVSRLGHGWVTQAWIGKRWDGELDAGASVVKSW